MLKYYRNLKKGNTGSMPVALFLTIMFLTLSVGIASVVASSIAQNRLEDNTRIGEWALTSAIAQAGEKVGPSAQALMNVATSEPATWSALAVNNSNSFSRWWVSSSANAVVNPSIIPAGTWSTATYGNNTWVAIDSLGNAYTSPDGTNWVTRNSLPNAGTVNYKLSYGLGYFIALPTTASASIVTSADGVTWSTATLPASSTYTSACSSTTCLFLSLASATGYYSANLSSFTTTGALPFTPESVAFSVNAFVMSGNNAIANSNTGTSWIPQSISAHNWGIVNAINGTFTAFMVSTTGSNIISTSSDGGSTWTDHSLPMSGNWVGAVSSGTQEAAYSGSISGVAQSTYVYSSDGLTWVTGSLLVATAWTGAAASTNGFLAYSSATATAYFIPVTSTASANKTLTVSARVQAGRVTGSNNAQYLASMVYSWNTSKKQWIASKYLGSSSASLSAISGAPTGVTGSRTSSGTIIVSWVAPVSTGSSSITSYVATASAGGYYCSSGQLTGTTCNTVSTYSATHNAAYYSCTTGDSPSGTQASNFTCSHAATYSSAYTTGSYTCTSGDSPSGTQTTSFTCTHTITYSANYQAATYTCTSGDSPSGVQSSSFTCTHYIGGASYATPTYSCTSGDSPSNTQGSAFTCTHATTSTYSSPLVSAAYYSCSSGTLSGSNCLTTYAAPNPCVSGYSYSGGTCTDPNVGNASHNNWDCGAGANLTPGGWWTGAPNYWGPSSPAAEAKPYGYCTQASTPIGTYDTSTATCSLSGSWSTISDLYGTNAKTYGGYVDHTDSHCYQTSYTYTATDNQYCPSGGTPATGSGTYPYSYTCVTSSGSSYAATYNSGYYYCPSGGSLSGSTCTTSSSYGATYYAGYYYCPSGGSLSGSTCTTTGSYAATPVYGCYSGATLSGTTCYNGFAYRPPTTYAAHVTGYSCPSGGSLSGSTCNTSSSYGASYSAGYYSCPSGGSLSGSTCTTSSSYGASYSAGYYSCPSGGSLSGSTCTIAPTGYTSSHQYYSCPSGGTLSGSTCSVTGGSAYLGVDNETYCGYLNNGHFVYPGQSLSPTLTEVGGVGGYCQATYSASYNCGSDTNNGNGTCTNTTPATYNPAVYQCTSGDSPSGTQSSAFTCTHTTTSTYTSPQTGGGYYYCSSGTLSGTSCYSYYASPMTAGYYYCTSGDTPSGNQASSFTCTNTTTYTSPGTAAYYSCTSGDTPSGTQASSFTCTHTATYNSNFTPASYSCASGTLAGNLCLTAGAGTQALYNSGGYTCTSPSVLNCTMTNMATGYYTFTVVASNGVGSSPSSVASSGVQSQPSVLSYPSSVFSTGQYNQTLSPVVTNTSGGSLSYSESGPMPSGVTFNNSTGVITGPASWGSTAGYPFTISVSATDAGTGITTTTPITFTLVIP